MTIKYYQLEDDVSLRGRWYLNGLCDSIGQAFDAREFTYGKPVKLVSPIWLKRDGTPNMATVHLPLTVGIRRKGSRLDFTYADFELPVVTRRVATMLRTLCNPDIQLLEVRVLNCEEELYLLNVTTRINCVDTNRSEIEWWEASDNRPEKTGKPRMISELVIDADMANGSHMLRPEGWEVALIVSEAIKTAFEREEISGVRFCKV